MIVGLLLTVIGLQLVVLAVKGYILWRMNRYDEKLDHITRIIEANEEDVGLVLRGVQQMGIAK